MVAINILRHQYHPFLKKFFKLSNCEMVHIGFTISELLEKLIIPLPIGFILLLEELLGANRLTLIVFGFNIRSISYIHGSKCRPCLWRSEVHFWPKYQNQWGKLFWFFWIVGRQPPLLKFRMVWSLFHLLSLW